MVIDYLYILYCEGGLVILIQRFSYISNERTTRIIKR